MFVEQTCELPPHTRSEVIRWWEARRHTFNVTIIAFGIASYILVLTAGSAAVKPGEDFVEPLMLFFGPGIYLLVANLCYTLGWIVDTLFYTGVPRERLYKAGLSFSAVLTALPGSWALVAWLITLYTGHKLD